MGIHAFDSRGERRSVARFALSQHWLWLAGGLGLAFAFPFLLTDVAAVNRDVFYGLYAVMVIALLAAWSRSTGYDLVAAAKRHWVAALLLGIAAGGLLAATVLRTEDSTPRPDGLELAAAVAWRGIVYGITDGLLLSVSRSSSSSQPSRGRGSIDDSRARPRSGQSPSRRRWR